LRDLIGADQILFQYEIIALFADPQILSWMISFVVLGREGIPGLVGPA
jgi:hypothetical protein